MKSVRTVLAICVLLAVVGPLVAAGSYPAANRQYAGAAPGPAPKGTPPMTDDSLWIKADSVNIGSPGAGGWNGTKVYGDTIYQVNNINGSNYIIRKFDRLTGALLGSFSSPTTEYAMGIAVAGDSVYVSCFYPADQFDVYTRSGTYVRTFAAPSGRMCRGLDWDGSQFWVADNNTTLPSIYTMDRAGTVLKTFTNTGSPAAYWIFDLAFDRMIPNRLWLNDETSPGVTNYCSFDTSANTYSVLAAFTNPVSPDYPEGIGFWGPELGAGYVYTVGATGSWVYKMQVHAAAGFKVLLAIADDSGPALAADILAAGAGAFTAVDYVDWGTSTLRNVDSVYNVAGYQVILTWPNSAYQNDTMVGDSLAKYVEMHGGVVSPVWCEYVTGNHMEGRYMARYSPVPFGGNLFTRTSLGTVQQPGHPIMQGVSTVNGTYVTDVTTINSSTYASRIADWSTGQVECATYDSVGYRTAFLGFWPNSYFDTTLTGNWMTQLVNALKWVHSSPPSGQEEAPPAKVDFSLRVAPNPFSGKATVSYSLPAPANVSLKLYDVTGSLVSALASGRCSAGRHSVSICNPQSGRRLAQGIYLLRLETGGQETTKKLILE
jgi:hypothetical protein